VKQQEFEKEYRSQWEQFAKLLDQLEGKQPSDRDEMAQFTQHYRRVCQLLGIAKCRCYSTLLVDELNQLVIRGHQQLYRRRNHYWLSIVRFVLHTFPELVRQERRLVGLSLLFFYLPVLLFGLLTFQNERFIYSIMQPQQVAEMEAMYKPSLEKIGRVRGSDTDLYMFGFYINNNISVGFRTFAGGILFGLGSIFFLFYNGMTIGAVAGYLTQLGYGVTFYPFIAGHAAFELTAIVLAGAAGLRLGQALISPGPYTRIVALRQAGLVAIQLIYGVIGMLVIAACLEAFWSSSGLISNEVKFIVAACFWLIVVVYFLFVGRQKEAQ